MMTSRLVHVIGQLNVVVVWLCCLSVLIMRLCSIIYLHIIHLFVSFHAVSFPLFQ